MVMTPGLVLHLVVAGNQRRMGHGGVKAGGVGRLAETAGVVTVLCCKTRKRD